MIILLLLLILKTASAVLDPALYLAPSPPLTDPGDGIPPAGLWSQTRVERHAFDLAVIPIEKAELPSTTTAVTEPETMEKAETIWPLLRTTRFSLGSIHVPLTFSLTGGYGRYGTPGVKGVIASSYGSVSDDDGGVFGLYGKSALAGSSYGSYSGYPGTRIYGSGSGSGWSGWGNGRWGHYGKG